jgi:hypothetical protein
MGISKKTETEYVLFTVFLIGVIVAVYYLLSLFASNPSPSVIIEKMILVGIFISILIVLAIVLYKQIEIREEVRSMAESGGVKAPKKRTVNDAKKDMMRIYRDMGALKIIMKDGIIEKKAYDEEMKMLDNKISELKKEQEKLAKK